MICNLCPRHCGALRSDTVGEGVCAMPAYPVVARGSLHMWEEPPISGTKGSGTVFFSGCTLKCVFCQNEAISYKNFGKRVTVVHLKKICLDLIARGAHNVNLVNPGHFAHVVEELLEEPLGVPVVWNSGGYDRVETLRRLEGKVDIYLPDLKYTRVASAERYSCAPDYPEVAKAAIIEMVRQTGPCVIEDGLLKRGTVIRHLMLPSHLEESREVMDWVAATFPPKTVLFSLMSQYTPWGRAGEYPEINRTLRPSERRGGQRYMEALWLDGFVQESESANEGYIPAFDLTGILS